MNLRAIIFAAMLLAAPPAAFSVEGIFDSNGVKIRYIEEGKGTPVLLIHGQNASTESSWITAGVVADLSRDYRVVAFDLRGHGKSEKPHDPKAYGREIALDAIRLLDHLGIAKAHFVGYSLGGNITTILMTTHPNRFLSATLLAGGPRFDYPAELIAADELEASEREKDCTSRSFIARLSPPGSPPIADDEFKKLVDTCMANKSFDRFAIAAYLRSKPDLIVAESAVSATRMPVLGIGGSIDPNLTLVRNVQRLRPDMKVVIIENATHMGPTRAQNRPEFIKAVREFLASHTDQSDQNRGQDDG
jgi:pimeloyl-ACP methyl ester carboxylesterase